MSEYQPGLNHRGTCPHCEQRCRVRVPKGGDGSARVCCWHKLPWRQQTRLSGPRCPGTGDICREDEK